MNPEVLLASAVALLLLLAFVAAGGVVLSWLGVGAALRPLRQIPLAGALGFAVFSYLAYFALVLYRPPSAHIVVAALLAVVSGLPFLMRAGRDLASALAALRVPGVLRWSPFGLIALAFLGLHFLEAASPPHLGDALQGYMFTSRWLHGHGFVPSPWNLLYGQMPNNTEAVFSLSFAFGTDLAAKLVDYGLGLLFVLALIELASRYSGPLAATLCGSSLALTPGFFRLLGGGKIDIAASFTLFAAFSLLLLADSSARPGSLVSGAAFLAGTSAAQKYTIWLFLPSFVLAVILVLGVKGWRSWLRWAAQTGAICLLCLIPHFVKNVLWTGNPLAPFATGLIPSRNVYLQAHFDEKAAISLGESLAFPYYAFFDWTRHRWHGWLPPLLLLGVPLAVWHRRKLDPRLLVLLTAAAIQLALWVGYARGHWLVVRFLLVPLALLLVVSAPAVEDLLRRRPGRALLLGGFLVLAAYFGVYESYYCKLSWRWVFGVDDRAEWHEQISPNRGYRILRRIAPSLGPGRRLFLMRGPYVEYNVPEEVLHLTNTEEEFAACMALPDAEKLRYLREHGFCWLFAATEVPDWASGLPVEASHHASRVLRLRPDCP
ncbi:MAG TPA: hypothetical protein VH394_08505 [Thermoanaerobaculia bacterium]|jgi:hypothetical protein|nr:hypothetical protein [Thermoanaerobaculia bacterium]